MTIEIQIILAIVILLAIRVARMKRKRVFLITGTWTGGKLEFDPVLEWTESLNSAPPVGTMQIKVGMKTFDVALDPKTIQACKLVGKKND